MLVHNTCFFCDNLAVLETCSTRTSLPFILLLLYLATSILVVVELGYWVHTKWNVQIYISKCSWSCCWGLCFSQTVREHHIHAGACWSNSVIVVVWVPWTCRSLWLLSDISQLSLQCCLTFGFSHCYWPLATLQSISALGTWESHNIQSTCLHVIHVSITLQQMLEAPLTFDRPSVMLTSLHLS